MCIRDRASTAFGSFNGSGGGGDDPFGSGSTEPDTDSSDDGSSDDNSSDDSGDGSGGSGDNSSDSSDNEPADDVFVLAGLDLFDSYSDEAENAYAGGAWDNYTFGGISSATPTFTVTSEELGADLNLILVERTEITSSTENVAFAEVLDLSLIHI